MFRRHFLRFLAFTAFAAPAAITIARARPAGAPASNITEGLQDMIGWQTIASAPKDGTRVLLFYPKYRQPVQIGWFHDSATMEYGKVVRESRHWMNGLWPGFSVLGQKDEAEPTHWAPIPSSPPTS